MIEELVITPFQCPVCPRGELVLVGAMLGSFFTLWFAVIIWILLARVNGEPEEDAGD